MVQKKIWSSITFFPLLVMFFLSRLAETNRAPFDAQVNFIALVPVLFETINI